MAITVHPFRGYLNTLFYVHVTGVNAMEYRVIHKIHGKETELSKGQVSPNEPFSFQVPIPGEFTFECSDGTIIPLTVEDGYKYGGSSFKQAFIFDDCSWLFIVMHDRTYFYNRETKEAYVETISPDEIIEVSSRFVIFSNDKHNERTLYSLEKQTPILYISNIIFYNSDVLVWEEKEEDVKKFVMYSLSEQREIYRVNVDLFAIDHKSKRLILCNNDKIETIELFGSFVRELKSCFFPGNIVNIVAPNLVINYQFKGYCNFLFVYDIENKKLIKKIEIKGTLAQIGDNKLIDVWKRQQAIKNFDVTKTDFPDATISADYYEFEFYPCEWDVFYTKKHIHLDKIDTSRVDRIETCYLHACIRDVNQPIQSKFDHFVIYYDSICLYNSNESFVRNKTYSAAGYDKSGKVYVVNGKIYGYENGNLFTLSRNGYWDSKKVINVNFEYLDKFNVIENKDTKQIITLEGVELGRYECIFYFNDKLKRFLRTSENLIYSGGRVLKRIGNVNPTCISERNQFGLDLKDGAVYLYTFNGENFIKEQILNDIFDFSKYREVLLSEDGNSIMHRDGNETIIMNIANGTTESYDNVSFVKHVNGIRPVFEMPASLLPRLVNPVTKRTIDCNLMSKFQFISPDGTLYADTRLKEYIEYYWLSDNTIITHAEYSKMIKKYQYPWQEKLGSSAWNRITELRRSLILEHFDYINNNNPGLLNNDRSGKYWNISLLDLKNTFGVLHFLKYFIGERGIAYIRSAKDDSVYAKIELGCPLSYINYVSFSYDSRYVSIAGYRSGGNSSYGGLFIIYDLINHSFVASQNTKRAVWVTAFSKLNALASYTSSPNTFFAGDEIDYQYEDFDNRLIRGKNFLTFSPDGVYFALSEQGYISKYDRYGDINTGWGHQPSSLVEVRLTNSPEICRLQFDDISDLGIADVATRTTCVASVSFSNDNKRIMMVGNDGVVIIRNLHIDDYAGE